MPSKIEQVVKMCYEQGDLTFSECAAVLGAVWHINHMIGNGDDEAWTKEFGEFSRAAIESLTEEKE
jgi:hypothetical protein